MSFSNITAILGWASAIGWTGFMLFALAVRFTRFGPYFAGVMTDAEEAWRTYRARRLRRRIMETVPDKAKITAIGRICISPAGDLHLLGGWRFEIPAGVSTVCQHWDKKGQFRYFGYTKEELIEIHARRADFL